jgi:predicted nucleotidyltransferase
MLFVGYRGSIAHGMYVPDKDPNSIDDKDLIGVFVAPIEHYLGYGRPTCYERKEGKWDVVLYELRKFVGLLCKQNPNVLSALWLEDKHVLLGSREWDLLRGPHRGWFQSKQAYHSFSGYAHSQLRRMTHCKFKGYMGEKRKQLVEKYGYDTKNAAHLIRLLRMAIEYLTEGRLFVERTDAASLLAIKQGERSLEEVKREAETLFEQARDAYIHSKLPDQVDREQVEQLLVNLISQHFFELRLGEQARFLV